jgi:hypothetical protein
MYVVPRPPRHLVRACSPWRCEEPRTWSVASRPFRSYRRVGTYRYALECGYRPWGASGRCRGRVGGVETWNGRGGFASGIAVFELHGSAPIVSYASYESQWPIVSRPSKTLCHGMAQRARPAAEVRHRVPRTTDDLAQRFRRLRAPPRGCPAASSEQSSHPPVPGLRAATSPSLARRPALPARSGGNQARNCAPSGRLPGGPSCALRPIPSCGRVHRSTPVY